MLLRTTRVLALVSVVFLSASVVSAASMGIPGDGNSDVVYDFLTGTFDLVPDGQPIGAFQMVSADGIFVGDAAALPPGLFAVDADNEVGVGAFNAPTNDVVMLGPIAAPGLTKDFLLQDLTTLRGSGGFGTQNRDFGLIVVNIPEPTSMFLAGLGLIGLVGYMRRR